MAMIGAPPMTAGWTFVLDKSVNGNGTKTIPPCLKEDALEVMPVRHGINIFTGVVEEIERFTFLGSLGNQ